MNWLTSECDEDQRCLRLRVTGVDRGSAMSGLTSERGEDQRCLRLRVQESIQAQP